MAPIDRHHSPALRARLRSLLLARDWGRVVSFLAALPSSQLRGAVGLVGEAMAEDLPDDGDFWALSAALVRHNSRAFLLTLLKSAVGRRRLVGSPGFEALCAQLRGNEVEVRKTLRLLLPLARRPEDVLGLFGCLGVDSPETRVACLLPVSTLPASYALLLTLRGLDHDRALLLRAARYLMKRGDDRSFNLASLLKTYFGLDELGGTFARGVAPYQLARVGGSYEAFCRALSR